MAIPIENKKREIRARTHMLSYVVFLLEGNKFSELFSLALFLDTKSFPWELNGNKTYVV